MEGAALDPRLRSDLPCGAHEALPAIGDDHVGRGDPPQEVDPGLGMLMASKVPAQHVLVAARDQHDRLAP